ncbi:MAG TPA: hypothetical protein PKG52_09655 [bacterium]|nr:hypothetical protein [bacterium]
MPDSDIKWDEILNGVMKEGKSIKKRRLIVRSSILSLAVVIFTAFIFLQSPEKKSTGELVAGSDKSSEIEVALISNDAFFDNDLELLIY